MAFSTPGIQRYSNVLEIKIIYNFVIRNKQRKK